MMRLLIILAVLGSSVAGIAGEKESSAGGAAGFFSAREIDGVWWLIDPAGERFLSLGVNHISYRGDHSPELGYSPYGRVVSAKYGSAESWAEAAAARLREWGFNTAGAWSSAEMFRQGLAYAVILDIGARAGGDWQRGKFPDVFSEEFQRAAEMVAAQRCAPRRDDPLLLGYFTDNELRWGADWRSRRGLLFDFWELPAGAPGRREAARAVAERYGAIERFNEAWGTRYAGFAELEELLRLEDAGERLRDAAEKRPGADAARELEALEAGFLERVASRYFEVCAAAIRKADPNHLILGCRFAGYASKEVLQGMAKHVDLISYNHYGSLPPADRLAEIHRLTGKPVLLTEFSFKAMDSGLPNTRGAGKPVETQEDRAEHFEKYATALLELPFAVGYHWFEYADEPAEGRFDGENSNFGLVNIEDEPWEVLTARMRAVNARAGSIHARARRRENGEDSPVLAASSARIREHRAGPVAVRVVDAEGRAVAGAEVAIRQMRHEFLFGCNIFLHGKLESPGDEAAYRARFAALFNYATLPFYWRAYERERGEPDHAYRESVARWCRENGIIAKGHPLVWNHPASVPDWLPDDPMEVRALSEARVRDCAGRFRGLIDVWDVVNEATDPLRFDERNRMTRAFRSLGVEDWTRRSFLAAREAAPGAMLLINDYRTDDRYRELIAGLVRDGKPLYDAIGIQSHMHGGAWSPERTWEVCEAFARFGVPLHFTETTIVSGRRGGEDGRWGPSEPALEEVQAREIERFYTVLFSHPAVEAITWWDLADRGAWQRAPAGFLRRDLSPKPAYERLLELVRKRWWTDERLVTDENGEAAARAFYGDHAVSARKGALEAAMELKHARRAGGSRVELRLEKP